MSKILLVGPSWVGDMVMAQSLCMRLKQQDANHEIGVLAPPWSAPVLARMPQVAAAIDMPVGHGAVQLGKRRRIAKAIKKMNYQQAIVIPGSWKSALIPWLAGIPKRTGYIGEQRWGLLNDIRKVDTEALNVRQYLALAQEKSDAVDLTIPNPRLKVGVETTEQALRKFNIKASGSIIGMCPGAEYGPAKRWPVRHYAEVATAMLARGWQVWLFGSDKDAALTAEIAQRSRGCVDLAGKTDIGEAIDLMSCCKIVVSNDSGLMHIAAAVGSYVIALYGSSSDRFTPPLTENCARLALDLECRPCFQRECPLGHLNCLNMLPAQRVMEQIDRVIDNPAAPEGG